MFISDLEQNGEVSPYICALASQSAYKNSYEDAKKKIEKFSKDWEELLNSDTTINNFDYRGVAFINRNQKIVLIAHRGTEPNHLLTWIRTNFSLTKTNIDLPWGNDGIVPEAYFKAALIFSKNAHKKVEERFPSCSYRFVETGHSLGGMYAALNSYFFDCRAISFDSPSLGHILKDPEKRYCISGDRNKNVKEYLYTNYVTAPDLVNTTGSIKYGNWIRLYTLFQRDTQNTVNKLSAFTAVSNFFITAVTLPFQYTSILHDLNEIVSAFDFNLGVPYLQAEVLSWPNANDYFWWHIKTSHPHIHIKEIYNNEIIERNHRYEKALSKCVGYQIGKFLVPQFDVKNLSIKEQNYFKDYKENAESRFGIFYEKKEKVYWNFQTELLSLCDPNYIRDENYKSIAMTP